MVPDKNHSENSECSLSLFTHFNFSACQMKLKCHDFRKRFVRLSCKIHFVWETVGFFTIRNFCQIIWQIWSYTAQNKFHQNLLLVGFEPTTSLSSVSCSELGRNLLEISKVSFLLFHASLHIGLCLFLESIEHDFMKALMIHTDNQVVT